MLTILSASAVAQENSVSEGAVPDALAESSNDSCAYSGGVVPEPILTWIRSSDDGTTARVDAAIPTEHREAIQLRAVLTFHDWSSEWTVPLSATREAEIELDLPPRARAAQADYVSQLVLHAEALGSDGQTSGRFGSSEVLYVVYPTADGPPLLLDAAQAADQAPGGVFSQAERDMWAELGFDVYAADATFGPEVF